MTMQDGLAMWVTEKNIHFPIAFADTMHLMRMAPELVVIGYRGERAPWPN